MNGTTAPKRAKRRVAIPAVIAGGLSSLLLAFSMTPTFSALTAAITNNTNTAGIGSIVMQELDSTDKVVCDSSTDVNGNGLATCTLDKYGHKMAMVPGGSSTVSIKIKNADTSSLAASTFTLTSSACTSSKNVTTASFTGSATDLCAQTNVKITSSGATAVYDGAASAMPSSIALTTAMIGSATVPVGTAIPFTIVVTFNGSAITADATSNKYANLKIAQQLTWTFQA